VRWMRATAVMVPSAALCLVTACAGTQQASGHHPGPGTGSAVTPASAVTENEVAGAYFPASGAQVAAGAPLAGRIAAVTSSVMAACMTRRGFSMQAQSAAQAAGLVVNNSEFPDIPVILRTRSFDTGSLTAAQGPPVNLAKGKQQAYAAAAQTCAAAASIPFAGLSRASSSLILAWTAVVSQIQASAPVTATLPQYRSCMERQGVPATEVTASSSSGSFGLFLAWETGQETHASGQTAQLAVEQHWAVVFARCADTTVTVQERLQLARQAVFLRQHSSQVSLLSRLAGQELAASHSSA
jgi:hypothetical protein